MPETDKTANIYYDRDGIIGHCNVTGTLPFTYLFIKKVENEAGPESSHTQK